MATPSLSTTVGEFVKDRPGRSRIFEQLKIDYCCGGKVPLVDACQKKGLDPQQVLAQIFRDDAADTRYVDANAMALAELADHIEQTHHAYLRQELPRLDFMTHKVANVHGEHEPRLHQLRETFVGFQQELVSHMMKEETVLFPMIRQLEQSQGPIAFHCGSLANPIRAMEHEHDNAGDALERFRVLTDDFTPPDWACNTFRAMYDALSKLEPDMHQHVHKENNVLFPKALAREGELNGKAGV
jgi:regulator of cell morphogenesis and NO signaling